MKSWASLTKKPGRVQTFEARCSLASGLFLVTNWASGSTEVSGVTAKKPVPSLPGLKQEIALPCLSSVGVTDACFSPRAGRGAAVPQLRAFKLLNEHHFRGFEEGDGPTSCLGVLDEWH
jgi:hypothetical protein